MAPALSSVGMTSLALDMHNQPDFPGFGAWIADGVSERICITLRIAIVCIHLISPDLLYVRACTPPSFVFMDVTGHHPA